MNKNRLIITPIALAVLLMASCVFARDAKLNSLISLFNTPPQPHLLYPISDKIVLTGKDSLEFRWWNDFSGVGHFIFKIYKGYNMYASDLLYKQDLPPDASSIKIKSELFKDEQVYTWSLVMVSSGGQKSDKGFSSFKIIKK